MIAVMIAGAVATLVSLLGTRFLIVFFRTAWTGPADPRQGGPRPRAPHAQAGHADDGRAGDRRRRVHRLDRRPHPQHRVLRPGDDRLDRRSWRCRFMGFLDDWIKVRKGHNRGIFWKQKNYVTMLMSFGFAWWLVGHHGHLRDDLVRARRRPQLRGPDRRVGHLGRALIWATTNAVNVTDGLDGLAGGSALMGFGAFMIIGYWAFRNPDVYGAVVNPLDMGVMAAGFAGACLGFLWWNAAPARIFMGDVGALGIGSALAFLALTLNTHLLLAPDLRHQRDGGRLGGDPDGRVQGVRPQAPAVPDVADPPSLRARRLAGDDGDHPLLAALGDQRRVGAGDLHRRLHPGHRGDRWLSGRARARPRRSPERRWSARCSATATTVTVTDDRIDDAKRELATSLGVELHAGAAELDRAASPAVDLVSPAPGVPETHPLIDDRTAARRSPW